MARPGVSRRVIGAGMRLALILGLLVASVPARATDLVVRVAGVVGGAGRVRVAVCRVDGYPVQHGAYSANVAAHPGTVEVTLPGVTPGRYAVIVHHDRTGDGVVHKNWLGIPTDGVGISRDARGRFGPPDFDDAALDIAGAHVVIEIHLQREPQG